MHGGGVGQPCCRSVCCKSVSSESEILLSLLTPLFPHLPWFWSLVDKQWSTQLIKSMVFTRPHGPQYSILAVLGMLHTWTQSAFYLQWPPNLTTIKYTSTVLVSMLPHFQAFTSAGIERCSLILRIFLSVIAVNTSSMKLCRVGKHQQHLAHQC